MADTLTLLTHPPHWIDDICREIDTLSFSYAFDVFAPDAQLKFGVETLTGADEMRAFFIKIDSPLAIEHRILEVWDGPRTTFVRGEAQMSKKSKPAETVVAPFMWLFRRAKERQTINQWFVTAGPLATNNIM